MTATLEVSLLLNRFLIFYFYLKNLNKVCHLKERKQEIQQQVADKSEEMYAIVFR